MTEEFIYNWRYIDEKEYYEIQKNLRERNRGNVDEKKVLVSDKSFSVSHLVLFAKFSLSLLFFSYFSCRRKVGKRLCARKILT